MTKRKGLTAAEFSVLKFVEEYGGGIDFGGRGASAARRNVAAALIERGLLKGSTRAAHLTDAGRVALRIQLRRARQRERRAFHNERKAFEG